MKRNEKAPDPGERLSKGDWIRAATEALGRAGVASVRIEVLAKELNVTKGSFYWHFKDRDALLAEVLRAWRFDVSEAIAILVKQKEQDPRERLRYLLHLSTRSERTDVPGGRIEQAIREWAASSNMAADTLKQVDAERLDILTKLYSDCGLRKTEAAAYALLLYSYTIGSNTINSDLGLQATRTMRENCADILIPAG